MERKRIAVNTRLLLKDKLEGIGWFTHENLKRIVANHPEVDFFFIFDRAFDKEFIFGSNVQGIVIGPQARHPILFKIWFNYSVRRVLKKHKIDLFLSPDGYLSLTTKVPSIAVMHDLNFEHYPEDLPKYITRYYKKYFPLFAKKAKRIATVSQFSKQDIHEKYDVPKDKIDVVYNGVNSSFKPIDKSIKESIKQKYTDQKDFFIYIGSLHPRKNISRLLKAYSSFKSQSNSDLKLVIVGEAMWSSNPLKEELEANAYKNEIIFTGRLFNEELNKVLGTATAMTYVPYFEGFGIPILEAFACEVPIITSNVTSMPEVAQDAAILVDPFNIDAIADAMISIADNQELRETLVEKGRSRLNEFSWDKSATKLWECIKKELL